MPDIINVSEFMPDHGFEIWTKCHHHSVEICLFMGKPPSYRVLDNEETITMSGSFENALISAVSYLNPKAENPDMSAWWLKDYTKDAFNCWWLAHGQIIRDKYLASGHGLIYYLNDGKCVITLFNNSYRVIFHADNGSTRDDYFNTLRHQFQHFDDAVAFIKKKDAAYVEPQDPIDVFDAFAQSIFEQYITYCDYWLQDIDYPEQKTGLMRDRFWLANELNKIEGGWNTGGWLPYNAKEFRNKCTTYVLQRRSKGKIVRWDECAFDSRFDDPLKEECAMHHIGDLIGKLNPLR